MMYTVYDFINNDIEPKQIRMGWKIESVGNGLIALRYTALNFDWKSLEFLGDEAFELFLKSKSYANLKEKQERAMKRFKRTYFDAYSIGMLKMLIEGYDIKVDVDKLLSKTIRKKSKKMEEDNEERSRLIERSTLEQPHPVFKMQKRCTKRRTRTKKS